MDATWVCHVHMANSYAGAREFPAPNDKGTRSSPRPCRQAVTSPHVHQLELAAQLSGQWFLSAGM
eukprot:349641-Chlamydomonas_euryale.AAC.5